MICECLGAEVVRDATPEEIGATARKAIRSLMKAVDIPNIKELGIPLEATLKVAPLVTADTGFALAPYRITAAKVVEMLKSAYSA